LLLPRREIHDRLVLNADECRAAGLHEAFERLEP
jgi:hypothetical protein